MNFECDICHEVDRPEPANADREWLERRRELAHVLHLPPEEKLAWLRARIAERKAR